MDKPTQGMKISDPDVRSPRDSTSQRAEGLFTSELGIQSDDTDRHHDVVPTRTINLSDFQRRIISVGNSPTSQPIGRRNAGIYLLPRVPQVSVASAIGDVAADGGSVISAATSVIDAVVSDVAIATVTVVIGSQSSDSQTLITTSASSTPSDPSLPTSSVGGGSESSASSTPSASYSITSTWLSSYTSGSSLSSITSATSVSSGSSNTTSTSTWSSTSLTSLISSLSTTSTASTTGPWTSEFTDANGTTKSTAHSHSHSYPATTTLISSTRSGHRSDSGSPSSSDHSASTSSGVSGTGSSSTSSTVVQNPPGTGYTGSAPTVTSSAATTSSTGSSSGGGGPGLSPQQQQVVGGVVGGVAGLAVLLLVLLIILRWYRRRLKARGELPEQITASGLTAGPGQPVSEQLSGVPFTSQLASSLRRLKHTSGHTQSTSISSVTVPESERGFQRIAGRKIAPVLTAGGDGFGGNYGAFRQDGDPATPPNRNEGGLAGPSSHAHGPSFSRDFATPADNEPNRSLVSLHSGRVEGVVSLRPSPARTPMTVSPAASSVRLSIQHSPSVGDDAPPVPQIVVPFGQDDVGRTMHSQDGSRISTRSRSTGHGSRFAENI